MQFMYQPRELELAVHFQGGNYVMYSFCSKHFQSFNSNFCIFIQIGNVLLAATIAKSESGWGKSMFFIRKYCKIIIKIIKTITFFGNQKHRGKIIHRTFTSVHKSNEKWTNFEGSAGNKNLSWIDRWLPLSLFHFTFFVLILFLTRSCFLGNFLGVIFCNRL